MDSKLRSGLLWGGTTSTTPGLEVGLQTPAVLTSFGRHTGGRSLCHSLATPSPRPCRNIISKTSAPPAFDGIPLDPSAA
eukprot:15430543-Alexandrium_andersonii.AAC.1